MKLARVLGGVGRVLITGGTLILLFVVYQLWGTGIREAQAQNRLQGDFERVLEDAEAPGEPVGQQDPADGGGEPGGRGEGPDGEDPEVFKRGSAPIPELGEPVGRIRIPAIGVDKIVVQGATLLELRLGPGHFPETPLPGQRGNAAIAGHRTTYGAPFHRLDELQPGDEIFVETVQGEFRYEVLDPPYLVVYPNDVWVLDKDKEHPNMLTLAACHPKYSARQRIVARAELAAGQRALPATPAPGAAADQGQGQDQGQDGSAAATTGLEDLDGDDVAIWPTILLGVCCAAIWFAAWLVGRTWRPVPSYLLGLPVFLVALFFFFEEFSRLLPSSY